MKKLFASSAKHQQHLAAMKARNTQPKNAKPPAPAPPSKQDPLVAVLESPHGRKALLTYLAAKLMLDAPTEREIREMLGQKATPADRMLANFRERLRARG